MTVNGIEQFLYKPVSYIVLDYTGRKKHCMFNLFFSWLEKQTTFKKLIFVFNLDKGQNFFFGSKLLGPKFVAIISCVV